MPICGYVWHILGHLGIVHLAQTRKFSCDLTAGVVVVVVLTIDSPPPHHSLVSAMTLFKWAQVTARPKWAACEVLPCVSCLLPDAARLFQAAVSMCLHMQEPVYTPCCVAITESARCLSHLSALLGWWLVTSICYALLVAAGRLRLFLLQCCAYKFHTMLVKAPINQPMPGTR